MLFNEKYGISHISYNTGRILIDFSEDEFFVTEDDFSEVNENRLRYKLEILGHKYGFTTKGLSGISSERVWYNFYTIEESEELDLEDATII